MYVLMSLQVVQWPNNREIDCSNDVTVILRANSVLLRQMSVS